MSWLAYRRDPAYQAEVAEHLVFYSRITCVVTLLLVLAGVGLDLAFYPERASEFAVMRLVTSALIGAVLLSYGTGWGRRRVRILTYVWLALIQGMISTMIFLTDGERSVYFVGLTFALSGVGFFLPLSLLESVCFGLFTMFAYVVACALRPEGIVQPQVLAGNMTFILFYAAIGAVISIYSDKWRWLSLQLKMEVQAKNEKLEASNKALAQIKGHLVQQEKMAALGTLSAGLLHEVNNPVNYSLMAVNMGLKNQAAQADASLRECLDDAREGMLRVQKIVSDLKTFAYQKPGEEGNRVFRMEKAVESALRLTAFELKGIEVALDMPADTHVRGDEPAMIGVLINLLGNAAQAVRSARAAHPRIDLHARTVDGRLVVSVRDNGTGIQPEHLERVFEPFFTTRDVGQGLGLGLSVSYAIIQRHGGTLRVASQWGQGTEFSFDLALASPQS
jgi:two-component system, sensor histidine kinase PhcS